jgi:hypothetical protein
MDTFPKFKPAVAQATPIRLDREATTGLHHSAPFGEEAGEPREGS